MGYGIFRDGEMFRIPFLIAFLGKTEGFHGHLASQ